MELNFYTNDNIVLIRCEGDVLTLKNFAQHHHGEPVPLLWYRVCGENSPTMVGYYEQVEVHLTVECINGSFYRIE